MEAAKLKSYLECPICFLLPGGRIFACVNSHQICESCYNKLPGAKHCPQGCGYDDPPRRARCFETLIENSDFKQECSKPGCTVEMKKDSIAAHELKCIFRTVPCPSTSCQKQVMFKNIDLHLKEHLKDIIIRTQPSVIPFLNEAILSKDQFNWVLHTYKKDELQFFPTIVKRNSLWYFWVTVKGDPEVASTWVFFAEAKNYEKKMSVEFSGYVHPIDSRVEEIIGTGQYMILDRGGVEKLQVVSEKAVKKGYSGGITISFVITKA